MNIVTLFMQNKSWSVLITISEGQHVYFFTQEKPGTREQKRGRILVAIRPFCSSPKNLTRRFLGDLTSFQFGVVLRARSKEEKLESSPWLIIPDVQRLPLIPGKVLVYGNLTGNL